MACLPRTGTTFGPSEMIERAPKSLFPDDCPIVVAPSIEIDGKAVGRGNCATSVLGNPKPRLSKGTYGWKSPSQYVSDPRMLKTVEGEIVVTESATSPTRFAFEPYR